MLQISTNNFTGSVVTSTEVFNYAGSASLRTVVIRVELGNNANPIAGNGVYGIYVVINGKTIVPLTAFTIPAGTTQAMSVSKELILAASETLAVNVVGQAGDTAVNVITRLYDVTPVSVSEILGNGATLVNHDYPNDGDMIPLDGAGAPIVGACIYIYSAADYDAGDLGPTSIIAKSVTTTDGLWSRPVSLDAGDYYAYFFRQGVMSPTAIPFTVT